MITDTEFEHLNALADGELAKEDATALYARLDNESALKETFDKIMGLKKSVGGMHHSSRVAAKSPVPAMRQRAWPIAASIAILAVASIAGYVTFEKYQTSDMHTALAFHNSMSKTEYVVRDVPAPMFISTKTSVDVRVPDLSASRLFLADHRLFDAAGSDIAVMHYRGFRGCRLTLWVGSVKPETLIDVNTGLQVRDWTNAGRFYRTIAMGMDVSRFESIVAHLEQLTVRDAPAEGETIIAMGKIYEGAKPCA